jgi:hypothetical protein
MDRLRVGGWLPPARSRFERGAPPAKAPRAGPAHAAPDDEGPDQVESPAPYEAPPVDLDEPVPALVPHRRAAPHRSRTFDTGPGFVASVGKYVYQGRRSLGEMMSRGPRRQQTRLTLAGLALLAVAIAAVAMLSPDGEGPGAGQGFALPTGPPRLPAPSADQEIGSASPEAPASPTQPRTTPPRSKTAPAPPPVSRPGPLTITYEAEDAALVGGAEVISLAQASGGRIVHNIGSEPGRQSGLLLFTKVDVPATNRYALTVDYVSGEDRTAVLTINTETSIRLSFPSSGGWDTVASRTFTITLVGGRNDLLFSNKDDWAPRLDRISLLG